MAVRASRTVTVSSVDYTVYYTFECGQFDLIEENTPGVWTEIWRDCDLGTKTRRTLYPMASGLKGVVDVDFTLPDRLRHRKYIQGTDDSFTSTLDLSDINDGVLPSDFCRWLEIYQNGKKLPCEAIEEIDFSTAVITIDSAWRIPGASYEVIFWAAPSGGVSSPGT